MQKLDLYNYRQEIRANNIILSFEGTMSQGVLTALIDALNEKVTANNVDLANSMHYTIRKICSILVELAQNIQNHSLEQAQQGNTSSGLGIIVIREDSHYFSLTSGPRQKRHPGHWHPAYPPYRDPPPQKWFWKD